MAVEEGHLSYRLWTTWPATLSTGTLPCVFSTTVCQTEQHHGGCWVLLVIHDPQSPCLSKRQDRCKGLNRMNQASVCVGSCVLLQAAASDRPAKLGLGLSWCQGLKGRVLGHCVILCDPMDLNPPGSSVHEGREGSAQLRPGVWQVRWPDGCIHLQTWGVGGGTKAATFQVYLVPRTLKILFHVIF